MADEVIYVHLLGSRAILPRQEGYSNIYMLFAPENFVVSPRGVLLMALQLSVNIPPGYLGQVFSLADMTTRGIFVCSEGVQPSTYWELSIVLFNHSDQFFYGFRGQAVACLRLERVVYPAIQRASIV